MKVILLKDVKKLGKKYETKEVSNGHALNLLIPMGQAEVFSEKAEKKMKVMMAQDMAQKSIQEDLLFKNIAEIGGISVTLTEKANEKGHLFASIHKEEIVKAVKEQKTIDILPDFVVLEKPIKEIGSHQIEVKVKDKSAKFTLVVEAK